ncbi:MAG: CPBP family intramembrane metalloprotease [Actinobacteria bacterium]|nr:CPBP family intramembrane metalloprotease [Actinomycetota bacterium]
MPGNSPPRHSSDYRGTASRYSLPTVIGGWLGCYLVANILGGIIAGASSAPSGEEPIWILAASALALWTPFIVMLVVLSRKLGSGHFWSDYFVRFRPIDALGIPLGVASQILLVSAVYWPLRKIFPSTFDAADVEERARDLYDRAHGGWLVVLVLIVVVGAPIVEELVYRGFIQGTLRGTMNEGVALVVTAVWFTLIHLTPVEYPGLFVIALVLGFSYHFSRRIGLSIVTHMAFNATGLLLVAVK